ncbi:hypothetical protein KY331_03160 [Candidatus Woesearchaeota archaeon]|nr:hypothetical protein [Candidatus Woesearchaeota archaeon]
MKKQTAVRIAIKGFKEGFESGQEQTLKEVLEKFNKRYNLFEFKVWLEKEIKKLSG